MQGRRPLRVVVTRGDKRRRQVGLLGDQEPTFKALLQRASEFPDTCMQQRSEEDVLALLDESVDCTSSL